MISLAIFSSEPKLHLGVTGSCMCNFISSEICKTHERVYHADGSVERPQTQRDDLMIKKSSAIYRITRNGLKFESHMVIFVNGKY